MFVRVTNSNIFALAFSLGCSSLAPQNVGAGTGASWCSGIAVKVGLSASMFLPPAISRVYHLGYKGSFGSTLPWACGSLAQAGSHAQALRSQAMGRSRWETYADEGAQWKLVSYQRL